MDHILNTLYQTRFDVTSNCWYSRPPEVSVDPLSLQAWIFYSVAGQDETDSKAAARSQ